MRNYLAIANSISTALVSVLTVLAVQYPAWTWVPIAAGALSMINLHVIPAVSQAYTPKAAQPTGVTS